MSASTVELMRRPDEANGYDRSKLNAIRHGVLSRHRVLPWEDAAEYQALVEALTVEHQPAGPTEHHLVEELAGALWRNQRLAVAEAAAHRVGLEAALAEDPYGHDRVLVRALVHLAGGKPIDTAAAAIRAQPEDTDAELRDLAEDEAMTRRGLTILRKHRADAYSGAVAALRADTRAWWSATLADADADADADAADDVEPEDAEFEPYQADHDSLRRFLENQVLPWYLRRRRELENRHLICAQAFGEALDPDRLDKLARYEVHLDRKLERVLGMLLKLQDLRRTVTQPTAA